MPNGEAKYNVPGGEGRTDKQDEKPPWKIMIGKGGKISVILQGCSVDEVRRRIKELGNPDTPAAEAFEKELLKQTAEAPKKNA